MEQRKPMRGKILVDTADSNNPYDITDDEILFYEDKYPEDATTKNIARIMRDKVNVWLYEDKDFCEKHGIAYAEMRMDFLVESEESRHWDLLNQLWFSKTIIQYLQDVQVRANKFIQEEKERVAGINPDKEIILVDEFLTNLLTQQIIEE